MNPMQDPAAGCALVVACVDPSEAAQPASMATLATVARLLRTKRA